MEISQRHRQLLANKLLDLANLLLILFNGPLFVPKVSLITKAGSSFLGILIFFIPHIVSAKLNQEGG